MGLTKFSFSFLKRNYYLVKLKTSRVLRQFIRKLNRYLNVLITYKLTVISLLDSSVQKDRDSGNVQIRSKCFRVVLPDGSSVQDFVYILIDPGLREITVFAHKF